MESCSGICKEDDQMELPPGFRFHPTDEELISHYLSPKVLNNRFAAIAIGEVDLNKCEPWDLPWRANMGEREWYFFCQRDRKYPTGLRTNRATEAGYWKATGKDKEIFKARTLVGMKKTLVFYKGRAPKGEKSNWVMHEYRLEAKYSPSKTTKNEWVISRIFQKSSGGKKTHISRLSSFNGHGCSDTGRSSLMFLPPLTDSPPPTAHVTCFSTPMEDQRSRDDMINQTLINNNNNPLSRMTSFYANQVPQSFASLQFGDSVLLQDKSLLSMMVEASPAKRNDVAALRSFADQNDPSSSVGPLDLDCLWNY